MNASPAAFLKHANPPYASGPALLAGLALAVFTHWDASAQLALDKIHGYAIDGYATYTPTGMGHSGRAGDAAMDLGMSGNTLLTITDPAFYSALNAGVAGDQLTVSMWVKLYQVGYASGFFFYSPTTPVNERGFQAHLPWGNDIIYFDTAGCCDDGITRISAAINTFPPYAAVGDDTWWTSWHHFVFMKNGTDKQIWIDGQLFLEGLGTVPLPQDFNLVAVGSGIPLGVAKSLQGQIDDFAVFTSGLTSNQVYALSTGTSPDALTGVNLVAYWDFNDVHTIISITRTNNKVVIKYTGTLQSAFGLIGPYTDVAGAPDPYTIPTSWPSMFYRARQ